MEIKIRLVVITATVRGAGVLRCKSFTVEHDVVIIMFHFSKLIAGVVF